MVKVIEKKQKPSKKEIKKIQEMLINLKNDPKAIRQAEKLISDIK